MNKKKWILLFFLFTIQSMSAQLAEKRKPNCSEILASEYYVIWTNVATITSIFYHIFKTGCLVCTQPECDYYSSPCKNSKWSRISKGRIPIYNNILEFGLSGKYFPIFSSIKLFLNENCYFKITVTKNKLFSEFFVQMSECIRGRTPKDDDCIHNTYKRTYWVNFDHQYCLYFGVATFRKDRLHITSSPYCNKFASANFNVSYYVEIENEECYYNNETDKPEAEYRFRQDDDRDFDGVPVILPCSPGGFSVDPKTGRFVIGEPCWKMFSDSTLSEGLGINFLIKNMYNNTEDLIFPTKNYRTAEEMTPMYLQGRELKAADRESMKPKPKKNLEKGNRRRRICKYEDTPTQGEITECSKMLSLLKQEVTQEFQEHAINAYTQKSAGCFVCAKPSKGKLATFSLPVYNNLFEFGLSGEYFPEKASVFVKLNKECLIKIEIVLVAEKVTINLSECLANNCKSLPVANNSQQILFNNFYCTQVALAFHDPKKLFYAFSFRCDKFAGSLFNDTRFAPITQSRCQDSDPFDIKADFELEQNVNRNKEGVPILLPCSAGGYAVDSKTGRFTVNQTCDDIFWETLIHKNETSGIIFIIKKVFEGNEKFLYKRRKDVKIAYPIPIYMKANGEAETAKEAAPEKMIDTEMGRSIREKCLMKREAEIEVTSRNPDEEKKATKEPLEQKAGEGGDGSANANSSMVQFVITKTILFLIVLGIRGLIA